MAFIGALVASLIVAFTGSQGGGQLSPVRLTLAGVALAAVLEGLTSGISLLNPDVYDQLRYWQAGSLDIRNLQTLKVVILPVLIAGTTALMLSRALNSLSLGSDTATALGSKVARTQLIGLLAITVLCGSATAIVGPIAFIGLMMPHMSRWLVGADHRWSLPVTLIATPVLLLFADIIGRLIVPGELRVSVRERLYWRSGADLSGSSSSARCRMMYVSRRLLIACLLLTVGCLSFALWGLRSGAVTLETSQIIAAFTGDAPRSLTMIVTEWRLPRVLMALLIGAALGVSGAIFQSLMRNPLGSPDVMGF
ncbi:iron-enterobactin transporter membrane protein [Citrobacter amalonaticus]|nr:iron-enterobactin transporter membrane protein [Citrobacter amalonaticus]